MTTAEDLSTRLAAVKDAVRKAPSDGSHRAALFQLYCIGGNWDGAKTQLEVFEQLSPQQFMFAQVYRKALACEVARAEVFAGKKLPLIFGKPSEWFGLLVQALRYGIAGEWQAALTSQNAAFEAAPTTSGSVNGVPFDWIADSDSRLGPILEAFVEGEYQWIPFDQIKAITFQQPADLIDAVWVPVTITWPNEGKATAFLPVRYPGSETQADDAIRFSKLTTWEEKIPDFYTGLGQRTFTTGEADYGVLDLREMTFNSTLAPAAAG